MQSYLGLFKVVFNVSHGVAFFNASMPFLQNPLSRAGLNPENIVTFLIDDSHGDPRVLRKFQNKICGTGNGSP